MDSEVDEYVASWHATMQLLREGKSFSGRERNCAFLNQGNHKFTTVSAVSGLDFADDGRAIASVDWDHDGDLDLWIQNRTGPRLRFMKNQSRESQPGTDASSSVSVLLPGVTCNRDAIGARVEIVSQQSATAPLVQTLRAGDEYLSQSSKGLHFRLRPQAALSLAGLGTNAGPAVPILIGYLRERNENLARFSAMTLGHLRPQPDLVVPAMIDALQDSRPSSRRVAAEALGQYGDQARPAVPALLDALNDMDKLTCKATTNALRVIAPETLTNAPAK